MDIIDTAKQSCKAPNHKILWSGAFLDGTLTFILPRQTIKCNCSDLDTYAGQVLMWHVASNDISPSGHIHFSETDYKMDKNFNVFIGTAVQIVEDIYKKSVHADMLVHIQDGTVRLQ